MPLGGHKMNLHSMFNLKDIAISQPMPMALAAGFAPAYDYDGSKQSDLGMSKLNT